MTYGMDETKRSNAVFWVIALALVGFNIFQLLMLPANHDISWLVHLSGRVLGGEKLYTWIMESNPPFIVFFNFPAVVIAKVASLKNIYGYYLYVYLIIIISLLTVYKLSATTIGSLSLRSRQLFYLTLIFIIFSIPYRDFGQREHLAMVLILPYLFSVPARLNNAAISMPWLIIAGLFAGLGFALKPFFIIIWLAVEIYTFFNNSAKRYNFPLNNLITLAIYISYIFYLVLFSNYDKMLSIIRHTYWAFDQPLKPFFDLGYFIPVIICLVVFCFKFPKPYQQMIAILQITTICFWLFAAIQQKWHYYHFYPGLALAILLSGLALCLLMDTAGETRFRKYGETGMIALLTGAMLFYSALQVGKGYYYSRNAYFANHVALAKKYANKKPVYALSTNLLHTFPLVNYSGAFWPYRIPSLWFFPGTMNAKHKKRKIFFQGTYYNEKEFQEALANFIIAELEKTPPELLIVDDSPEKPGFKGQKFDFIEYFSRYDRFKQLFDHYRLINKVDNLLYYQRHPSN